MVTSENSNWEESANLASRIYTILHDTIPDGTSQGVVFAALATVVSAQIVFHTRGDNEAHDVLHLITDLISSGVDQLTRDRYKNGEYYNG